MTEHCFNFADAEHVAGTNRYVFTYPEIWYTNQTIKDMSLGVRSIVLKPGPLQVKVDDLFVKGNNTTIDTYYAKNPNAIQTIRGEKLLANQMYIAIDFIIDEKMDMLECVTMLTEKYKQDAEKHINKINSSYGNLNYLDILPKDIKFRYDDQGNFIIESTEQATIGVDVEINGDDYYCGAFNEGFHELLGLDYHKPETNLNQIFAKLALGLYKYQDTISGVLEEAQHNGIIINDLATETIYFPRDGYKPIYFSRMTIKNVWSRKDILLTSSICEMDKRGYLGFSSNSTNNAHSVYPQPKMYDINNTNSKFWVEIFDSFTHKAIPMLQSNLLLIEAIVCQKPKRTFNRA